MYTRPIEGDKCYNTLSMCSKSVAMSVSFVWTDDQVEFALNIMLKQRNDWHVQFELWHHHFPLVFAAKNTLYVLV